MTLAWREAHAPAGEPEPRAAVPEGTAVYAIGDLHGRDDLVALIHQGILDDAAHRPARRRVAIYLGDYFSRGRDSRALVERVLAWRPAGFEVVTLKGNHEDLILRFMQGNLRTGKHWLDFGGVEALAQYGLPLADPAARDPASLLAVRERWLKGLPESHRQFLRGLTLFHREGGYFFVHGGVLPGVPLPLQRERDLIWIRKRFLQSTVDHGAIVVHGHCISSEPEVRRNRIGIDTGAYRSGILTCLVLDGSSRHFLQTVPIPARG